MIVDGKYADAPLNIQKILQGSTVTGIDIGCSNSHVYRIFQNGHSVYLKTQSATAPYSFAHEAEILQWLQGKLPVPEVLEYTCCREHEYLVLSEISGQNCIDAMESLEYSQIVFLLATGLRAIHAVDISACPFDERIDEKLKKARYNVEHNLVDEDDFDAERRGIMTSSEVLQLLESSRPPENNLVFTHGDYCLPNVIIQDGEINGFIDLGRAGIGDRYNDLAIVSRSIRDNLGTQYERLFFEYYGIERVDEGKTAYYRLMDELF